jgi:hypothetical protein
LPDTARVIAEQITQRRVGGAQLVLVLDPEIEMLARMRMRMRLRAGGRKQFGLS